jgi:hypothetical protein
MMCLLLGLGSLVTSLSLSEICSQSADTVSFFKGFKDVLTPTTPRSISLLSDPPFTDRSVEKEKGLLPHDRNDGHQVVEATNPTPKYFVPPFVVNVLVGIISLLCPRLQTLDLSHAPSLSLPFLRRLLRMCPLLSTVVLIGSNIKRDEPQLQQLMMIRKKKKLRFVFE